MDGVEKQQIAWQTRLRETTLDFPLFFVVMCRTNAEEKPQENKEIVSRWNEEEEGRRGLWSRRMKDSTNLWGKRTFETNWIYLWTGSAGKQTEKIRYPINMVYVQSFEWWIPYLESTPCRHTREIERQRQLIRGGEEKKTTACCFEYERGGRRKKYRRAGSDTPTLCIVYGRAGGGHGKMLCVLRGI